MKQTVIKYGLYGSITGLTIFTLHLVLGINKFDYTINEILGYISIFISLSFIFFGIKHYRDHINNGVVSLGSAILIGVLISILASIGIAIADFIYTQFINPSFFSDYEQYLIKQGEDKDDIFKMTSVTGALFMFVLVIIIGFIISLISGLILQRK